MQPAERGGFSVTTSHYEDPASGGTYHDEWLPGRLGGGQELVRVGEKRMTRLYGGGTVAAEALTRLGISENDVMAFLMKMIQQLGDATRLEKDCSAVEDGEWQYQYVVKEQLPEISLTVGKEEIKYRDEVVFVHYFLLTEVW